jgi:ectoine hydroxylase-related dioxygenase (phytanoyl-CoA dioxygenase family)
MVVPLVPLTEATGSTRLWPGSHLVVDSRAMDGAPSDPLVALGDCYLMDYRLMHGGMPNHSNIVRPILYNVYYRPWFRDYQNYPLQAPLAMSEAERRKVPTDYRGLFDWSFAKTNALATAMNAPVETLATQRFYPQPGLSYRLERS